MYNYKKVARSAISVMTYILRGPRKHPIEEQMAVLFTRQLNQQGMSEEFIEALLLEFGAFARAFHTYCIYPLNHRNFIRCLEAELVVYHNWQEDRFNATDEGIGA